MNNWMNVYQAADYLGVSKETIYRMLKRKQVKAYKLGKLWRMNVDDLDKAVQQCNSGSSTKRGRHGKNKIQTTTR